MPDNTTPPDMLPVLTIQLNEQEREAFRLAAPLFNRIDPDETVEWLDNALDHHGVLGFKPSERQSLGKSLSILSRRLNEHLTSLESPTPYDILRRLAHRTANLEKAAMSLEDCEREALRVAERKGPMRNDREDGPVAWLNDAIERGLLETPQEQRQSMARTIRVLAERLHDAEAIGARRRRLEPAQCLSRLAKRVASTTLILETDLRGITREAALCQTTVYISTDGNHPRSEHTKWLTFGQAHLRLDLHPAELRAYLPEGVTDFEHDSAWALVLPLVGVKLESLNYHTTVLEAFIAPRAADDFRVPWPGYDPTYEASICEGCEELRHPIVPEEFYTPYHDPDLYKEVEGRHVRITIGPRRPETEDEDAS